MAPGRLYRDYSLEAVEEDVFQVPPRRNPSLHKQTLVSSTPRTIIRPDEDETNGHGMDYDDDGRNTPHANEYHAISPNPGDVSSEPTLDGNQVDIPPSDSAAPAIPSNIRGRAFSPSVASEISRAPSMVSETPGKMPEFFSHSVFQMVLSNPTIAHQLLKFCQSRLCGENMEFLARVSRYHSLLNEVTKSIYEVHKNYISTSAHTQINLPDEVLLKVNKEMKAALTSNIPGLESIFVDAQSDIERLVFGDIYPKFVRYQMSTSAAKALGTDRGKYQGLGDCFVLTDPSKADNPIMFVSDGFVKVTGYGRNEIIPRNCRFLQTQHTDRAAVRRLKAAIEKREESVELLLNRKKNGEPFWNLLYTTPLFDANGKLVFFLGGQINCSTTIHSASDVLKILASTNESTEEPTPQGITPAPLSKAPRRSILGAFRTYSRQNIQTGGPGMEDKLVDRLEDMSLKEQMNTFYTAYSNFIILNYSTFLISFVSSGIVDMLFPIKAKTAYHAQAVGSDIFKFLANHGSGSLSWDFKSAVKGALKMGQAVSIEAKLCARPYMGFEKFILHWTPLKDENGAVAWVVVTLGSESRL